MSVNQYFEMLMTFSQSNYINKSHLVRKFTKNLFDSAVANGYIIEGQETADGDVRCYITELGKEVRDR